MAEAKPTAPVEESQWSGVEDTIEDPEEIKVIFQALDSFAQYAKAAHLNCTHLRRQSFYALPQAHWKMLAEPPFSYLETLDRVDAAIENNAKLARVILKEGLRSFDMSEDSSESDHATMPDEWAGIAKHSDVDKARSTIRQFYRDWSAEGRSEREACYEPIFRALDAQRARYSELSQLRVLVPGAGLGRLVFDLCQRGYFSEGNEISYHQLLASSFILNNVQKASQFTIYPWIHSFSNHRSRENQFKSYNIPDIHPQRTLEATQGIGAMQMCAADFLCLYGDEEHGNEYDAVAACFFLDTAPNLIRYLEVIRHCLKPGGILINVGPLLWHWEGQVAGHQGYDGGDNEENGGMGIAEPGSFELTHEEVVALVERMGFTIEHHETDIAAPYIQDSNSMLQTVYRAAHWVARKSEA
ncbi:methyltransferase family [Seiridium cupressi]